MPLMALCLSRPYRRVSTRLRWGSSPSVLYPSIYPSAFNSSASDIFSFDAGMAVVTCCAWLALRIRVSMSAIGSVIVMACSEQGDPSPRCLHDAGDLAGVGHLAQADPAQTEAAVDGARAP